MMPTFKPPNLDGLTIANLKLARYELYQPFCAQNGAKVTLRAYHV
jgi:hypothetical protein